jgi:tRNA uridine 5-carboxymethylaminomethyl modification enzyme
MQAIAAAKEELAEIHFKPSDEINTYLQEQGYEPLAHGINALELLKRPKITLRGLKPYIQKEYPYSVAQQVQIDMKYDGYIQKAKRDAAHLASMEALSLEGIEDYLTMENLSLEARSKLDQIRPATLGQASRISGINPADIAILAVYQKQKKNKE